MTATNGAGYKFDGWYKDGVLLTNDVTFTPVKGADGMFTSATYEAKFIPLGNITYTIEHMFEGLDGVYVLDPSLAVTDTKSGQEFSTVTETQAAGYAKTIRGFTYTPGLTGSIAVSYTHLDVYKRQVYAVWAAAPVTFTFQGGHASATLASGATTTATANYGSNLTTKANNTYTLAGNNFSNWGYTNAAGSAATVNASTAVPVSNFKITWSGSSEAGTLAGTATLTANWAPITYSISWNANGGASNTSTNNVNADTPITLPANPTRAGYTFRGWNTVLALSLIHI